MSVEGFEEPFYIILIGRSEHCGARAAMHLAVLVAPSVGVLGLRVSVITEVATDIHVRSHSETRGVRALMLTA